MEKIMTKPEVIDTIKTGHIAQGLMAFAIHCGAQKLKGTVWEKKVDDTWHIKVNAHHEILNGLQPFCWYVEFNGWPAGVMSITGEGILCAGEAGNEENLRKALLEAAEKIN